MMALYYGHIVDTLCLYVIDIVCYNTTILQM
jgi:hypothetical protein